MKFNPHNYQSFSIKHVLKHPFCGLFLDMGLGKTVTTLTACDLLIYELLEVDKVLVIAPKNVALNVWAQEVQKWDHLQHLRVSIIAGDPSQRVAAIKRKADIYVMGRDNVAWLVKHCQTSFPFDMLVIDELSSFKDHQSQRFRSLRIVRPLIKRVVGLTGTPAPNGLQDLWAPMYLLDQGERLGKNVTAFREAFLQPDKMNGHHVLKYKARPDTKQEIYDRIGDICVSMKAEDYLELPGRIEQEIVITLEPQTQKKYDQFERDQVMKLLEDKEITALNAAALTGKLLQFSNGALYDSEREVHPVHDQKLDALEEIVEAAQGQQVLIFYSYIHDKERILSRFKTARPFKGTKDVEDWNKGKVGIMLCHPASAGHGLNLQQGGHIIVWFGLTWSLELYQQANARLDRQGQTKPVMIYKLLCAETMDQSVALAIASKEEGQSALMNAVKARIEHYKKNL